MDLIALPARVPASVRRVKIMSKHASRVEEARPAIEEAWKKFDVSFG